MSSNNGSFKWVNGRTFLWLTATPDVQNKLRPKWQAEEQLHAAQGLLAKSRKECQQLQKGLSLLSPTPLNTQAPKVQLLCDVLFSLLGVVAWIKDATSTARSSWFFESSSIVTSPGFRWITEAIWKRRSWALTTPWQDNKRRTWCCTRTYSRW